MLLDYKAMAFTTKLAIGIKIGKNVTFEHIGLFSIFLLIRILAVLNFLLLIIHPLMGVSSQTTTTTTNNIFFDRILQNQTLFDGWYWASLAGNSVSESFVGMKMFLSKQFFLFLVFV